ncbi:MAG TPA: glycosyltransferase family 39 protein, partial [Myxococcus sp.]|nr:glycosyltransferase family 39 protein [Myxococcus sp.]
MNPSAVPPGVSRSRAWGGRALLFAGFFAVLAAFPVTTPFDSKLTLPTTLSLLREGNLDLDEYAPTFQHYRHGLFEHEGHLYNYFPLGPSLASLPMVALLDATARLAAPLGGLHPSLEKAVAHWRGLYDATGDVDLDAWNEPQRLFASVLIALAGVVMFELGLALRLSRPRALLLAAAFVLCTPLLSTASRAMWQHGPSLLCLTGMLLCLVRAREAPRFLAGAGLLLALAYVMRPTNSVSVLLLSFYVLWTHPRQAWRFLVGALLVAAPWVATNWAHYGSVLAPYYEPQRL